MPEPVRLNIYDMYWINEYASAVGFGIFHSGIEVYGVEYAYGGHPFAFSGIFTSTPQDAEELGETFKFRQSVYLGETALSETSVEKLVKSIGDEFRGDRYHLISKNCNHFSAYLAKELTGVDIPPWVNRLATVSGSVPFIQRWLPPEWLTPIALEQSLDDSEDEHPSSRATLNYPASAIDHAEEALTLCGTAADLKPTTSANGHSAAAAAPPQANSSASQTNGFPGWKLFRRTSGSQSAPGTSRANGTAGPNTTPPLARLWNSIKSLTLDEPPSSAAVSTSSAPRTPR